MHKIIRVGALLVAILFSCRSLSSGCEYEHIHNTISEKNWSLALAQLTKANQNCRDVKLYWGVFWGAKGSDKYNPRKAAGYLETAASEGDLSAKLLLVGFYLFGSDPLKVNYKRGLYWAGVAIPELEELAKSENLEAIRNLAIFYLSGIYKDKNTEYAFALFKEAANKGDVASMEKLAYLYQEGIGTEVNKTLSRKWSSNYKKSKN